VRVLKNRVGVADVIHYDVADVLQGAKVVDSIILMTIFFFYEK